MVKNKNGGNGHRSMARKFNTAVNYQTRLKQDPSEMFAVVSKMLGGGKCYVECEDGNRRLCIIRGKFRGYHKRDNIVAITTWVLVGLREFESSKNNNINNTLTSPNADTTKYDNCDLMEIYTDLDKKNIREFSETIYRTLMEKSVTGVDRNHNNSTNNNNKDSMDEDDCGFEFTMDDQEEQYNTLMKTKAKAAPVKNTVVVMDKMVEEEEENEGDGELNIDDI